jgi:hypothetical protein
MGRMASPSPRRRFQFRLRTLMIVVTLIAVPCAYVGWQAKIVRDRKAWLARQPIQRRIDGPKIIKELAQGDPTRSPSKIRLWLGDKSVEYIGIPISSNPEELKLAASLFPEAVILGAN